MRLQSFEIRSFDLYTTFYTKSGTKIATGATRIVFGSRGPYVEFSKDQIFVSSLCCPLSEARRFRNPGIFYYYEYRTADSAWVKIYLQRRTVSYADYKRGRVYIAPSDLYTEGGDSDD